MHRVLLSRCSVECATSSRFLATYTSNQVTGKTNLYDILGVKAKATQAEIKSAYYKLSMEFHPDKIKENMDGGMRFREITEAYEILGNYSSRKRYDRGLLNPGSFEPHYNQPSYETEVDEGDYTKFYRSRNQRSKPPPPRGHTPIYNFDEFYRMHYSDSLRRDQENLKYYYERSKYRSIMRQKQKTENVFLLLIFVFGILLGQSYVSNYDKPELSVKISCDTNVESKNKV
ncbi:dnaJ homolog subfamily C member 30-like [Limulus polyphemus]|uniref:DnaJ homolog subfamily C member 30-like n=1 Tax=Limulus polyphemus TaxID=6850 RepID=A0ABM1C1J4_LIMPO|nr:dnaJ homolog subfamily C member 30-like [Limulus polyphemus]